jgi:DNA-directed RNA polymerase specialized sigma24 family protein
LEAKNLIDVLAARHKEWFYMAKSFGCDDESANELVQEMYIKIVHRHSDSLYKIMYNETEINTYYVYIALRNLYLDGFHKYSKDNHVPVGENIIDDVDEDKMEVENLFDNLVSKIDDIVSDWYWYDKKMWNVHFYDKKSMRKIAKETKISLSSIFNTLSNGKEKIRESVFEEYQTYKRNQ